MRNLVKIKSNSNFVTSFVDDGKVIPKGTSIALNILELHRDPTVFPDPMKFDPERFSPENSLGRSPYTFVPVIYFPANHSLQILI